MTTVKQYPNIITVDVLKDHQDGGWRPSWGEREPSGEELEASNGMPPEALAVISHLAIEDQQDEGSVVYEGVEYRFEVLHREE